MYMTVGGPRWRRLVYSTKDGLLRGILASGGAVPSSVAFVSRPGLLLSQYVDLLVREVTARRARVAFVGDLDPLALSTYVSFLVGGFDRVAINDLNEVQYCGINDNWLELFREEMLPSFRRPTFGSAGVPVSICTGMRAFEKVHLRTLEESGLDLEAIVGRRCLSLLHEGCTIDLAAATDHRRFRRGFARKLERLVFHSGISWSTPQPARRPR
jgi:hypothetical protein